jgi:hypothetical protein
VQEKVKAILQNNSFGKKKFGVYMEQILNAKQYSWSQVLGFKLSAVAVFGVFLMLAVATVMTGPSAEPAVREEKASPVSVMSASPRSIPPVLAPMISELDEVRQQTWYAQTN